MYKYNVRGISDNLSRLPDVKQYGDEEAWTLADDFADLDKSFRTLLEELFPRLLNNDLSEEELKDTLTDIGDEFRHVVYHIGNSKFYSYLGVSSPELSDQG